MFCGFLETSVVSEVSSRVKMAGCACRRQLLSFLGIHGDYSPLTGSSHLPPDQLRQEPMRGQPLCGEEGGRNGWGQ